MMKKIITTVSMIAVLASCGGATKEATEKTGKTPEKANVTPTKLIQEIDGYFVTYKPKAIEVLTQGKVDWEANFNVAKTMDNEPTTIDFDMHKVGVIVTPETEFDTEIIINKTSVEDKKLVVDYSINTKGEKRTFTIVPMKAFLYQLTLDIDSVSFINDGKVTNVAK